MLNTNKTVATLFDTHQRLTKFTPTPELQLNEDLPTMTDNVKSLACTG